MKYLLASVATLSLTTAAYCGNVDALVVDRYTTIYETVPYTKNECVNVDVPVYGNITKEGGTADALVGGTIGGVIGNQFGGGSGKDVMTVLGALIGATQATKPRSERVVTGYKQEKRCDTFTYYRENERVIYDYSIVEWKEDGKSYSFTFDKLYREKGE